MDWDKLRIFHAAAQADGEEPTMEECKIAYLSAWERSRGPHARAMFWNRDEQAGLEAVRSLCMERAPAPSHALVEAVSSVLEHDCPVCFDQDPASQAAMKRWINLGNKYRAARSSLPAAKKEGGA